MVDVTKLKNGVRIRFINAAGRIVEDVIRGEVYEHVRLLEPYARNETVLAVVLTNHSWIDVGSIFDIVEDSQ